MSDHAPSNRGLSPPSTNEGRCIEAVGRFERPGVAKSRVGCSHDNCNEGNKVSNMYIYLIVTIVDGY